MSCWLISAFNYDSPPSHCIARTTRCAADQKLQSSRFSIDAVSVSLSSIRRALDLPHDVVSLREERVPIIQHLFLIVREIAPFRLDILGFSRGHAEGARGIVTGEDYVTLLEG